ncbi:MAG: PHB depolymerase family esterase [Mariprofundaceae bacterium]|nr:PHB depolymerase family esterase [Mariprofundaceae bacterium]
MPPPVMAEGMQKSVMSFQGAEREYYVHLPPGYDGRHTVPVVLVFHGGGGNARQIARHSDFTRLADQYGFIVVYPQAVDKHWNDGRNSEKFQKHDVHINDVAWIEALIGRIGEKYAVDGKRMYAVGISNGGMFCQRLAIEAGRYFAANASIAAQIPEPRAGSGPASPVSVLMINGTKDPIIPYQGGEIVLRLFPRLKKSGAHAGRGRVISTDDTVRFWLGHHGIDTGAESVMLADRDQSDGSTVERSEWINAETGVSVVLYRVIGGGHTWPGSRQFLPVSIAGHTNRDMDASEEIWRFFAVHVK